MGELDSILNPPSPSIKLDLDELLLLDWVLTLPMPAAQTELEWHMNWENVRLDIWKGIIHNPRSLTEIALGEDDIEILLAIIPCTFHWGQQSKDCGISLKSKLARYLLGEVEEIKNESNENEADNKAASENGTTAGTMADTGTYMPGSDSEV